MNGRQPLRFNGSVAQLSSALKSQIIIVYSRNYIAIAALLATQRLNASINKQFLCALLNFIAIIIKFIFFSNAIINISTISSSSSMPILFMSGTLALYLTHLRFRWKRRIS